MAELKIRFTVNDSALRRGLRRVKWAAFRMRARLIIARLLGKLGIKL